MSTNVRTSPPASLLLLLLLLGSTPGCISGDRVYANADADTSAAADTADTSADADADAPADADTAELGDTGAPACTTSSQCSDDDPCTTDRCDQLGACTHETIADCVLCSAPSDCHGQRDACDEARCDDGHCTYRVLDDCRPCTDVTPCADDDPCTTEQCETTCRYAAIDCDDADPCTTDRCDPVDGCVHDDTCAAPLISLGTDPTLAEGDTFERVGQFEGAASETFTATVRWTADDDAVPLALNPDGTFALSHRYAADGTYVLTVAVTDAHARRGAASLTVTVTNVAPAIATEPPVDAAEGALARVAGRVTDPGDDVTGLVADFGDESPPEAVTLGPMGDFVAEHVYADDGAYEVTLTASDDREAASVDVLVNVTNVAPTFAAPANRVVPEGTPTTVTLPIVDPGEDTFSGEVNYGLGGAFTPLVIAEGALVLTLDYPDNGPNYAVTVRLRDEDGGESINAFIVAVSNVAPQVLRPADAALVEGEALAVEASFVDPGADAWTALVSFGDGSGLLPTAVNAATRTVPLAYRWANDGVFAVYVQVSDDDLDVGSQGFIVTVANEAPTPNAGGDAVIDEGTVFARDPQALDPGVLDALSGTVSWDPAEAPETLAIDPATRTYHLERLWANEGEHTVAVTVRDDDDAETTETFTVSVVNVAPAVACGSHAVLAAGDTLVRGCSFVDPGADAWSATVDWGEGAGPEALAIAPDGTLALEHTFPNEGTYPVVVAVDDGTDVGEASFEVAVGNAPPLVDAGPPAQVDEGGALTRSGQAFDAGPGPFAATVDYGEGAGAEALALTEALGFTLSHVYAQDGLYTVTVTVTDGDDETGSDTVLVTVRNLAPVVVAGGDAALGEGGRLLRDVTVTDAGVLDVLTATVDYGDGGGPVALSLDPQGHLDHVYAQDGSYVVTVSASDDAGGVGYGGFTVEVTNGAPVVSAGADGDANEGATFERVVTFVDAGADTWTATVAWGDGAVVNLVNIQPGAPIALSHSYANEGDFTVRVTVHDGTVSGEGSFVVHVANVAPTVAAGGAGSVAEGSPFTRSGSASDPGGLDVLTATVDWGDGGGPVPLPLGPDRSFTLSRTFAQDGVRHVVVAVSDGVAMGTALFDLTVTNVAPVVSPGAAATLAEGGTLTRSISFTDPGADAWTATVDWGAGGGPQVTPVGPGKTVTLSHLYPDDGEFDVTIAVSDGVATGTAQLRVVVTNVAPTVHAGGPVTLAEGGTLTRSGSVTDPGASDTFTATVNYGDNSGTAALTVTPQRTFALSHVFAHSGLFTVTVVVTDHRGAVGSATFPVTVSNSAPVVTPGPDAELTEGQRLVRAVAFTDAGGGPWTATVDYDLGAGPEAATVDPNLRTVAVDRVYPDDGAFDVVVTVDDGTESGQGSFVARVANVAPTVSVGAAVTIAEGALWTRAGTFTDPGVLDTHTIDVDWGDGTAHGAPVPNANHAFTLSHSFADNGDYAVDAAVFDGDDTGHGTVAVRVTNVAPTLSAVPAPVGLKVGDRWQQAAAFSDPGADTWTYRVDYGDGTIVTGAAIGRSVPLDHSYALPGNKIVQITVTDDDLGSGTTQLTVPVANVAPTVNAGADKSVAEGSAVTVTASFDDPGTETHTATLAWLPNDLREGAVDEAAQLVTGSYTYGDDGVHDVTVTVIDAFGAAGSDVVRITVTNVAPVVDAGGDTTTDLFGHFTQAGSFGDPGADSWTVTVDYGDGTLAEVVPHGADKRFTLEHTYGADGDYTVEVTVADDDGGEGFASFDVSARTLDCSALPGVAGKVWLGGAGATPNGWSVGANWSPSGEPGPDDDVRLCVGNQFYPVLTGPSTARDVRMAPGTSVTSSGYTLTLRGSLLGGAVTGNGTVVMTGAAKQLGASTPNLEISGEVSVTGASTVNGNLTVAAGGLLGVASTTLVVQSNMTVWTTIDGKGLVLDAPQDIVTVRGSFTVRGEATLTPVEPPPRLTGGTLRVAGDFTQVGTLDAVVAFAPTGTLVELNGATRQKVSFADPGLTRSRFAGLLVTNAVLVELSSDVAVSGVPTLAPGARVSGSKKLVLGSALPSFGTGAVYEVTDTVIGAAVAVTTDTTFAWNKANLSVRADGTLTVGAHKVDVGGNLAVNLGADATTRGLVMGDALSTVVVRGGAAFLRTSSSGGAATPTPLTAGTLRLHGAFVASSPATGAPAFAPSGMVTRVEGAGVDVQSLSLTPANNAFGDLVLAPGARALLYSDVTVAGTLRVDALAKPAQIEGERTLSAKGVDVRGLEVVAAALAVGSAPFTHLEAVHFVGHAPTATPLTVRADALNATASGLVFEVAPTTGAYISGVDLVPNNGQLAVLHVVDSLPLYGEPRCVTTGQFAIDWGDPSDDSDDDQLPDVTEYDLGTDPLDPDSDDDTFLDGTEVGLGSAPLMAGSVPFALAAPTELAVGAGPSRVAVGHLNGDGILDLATANRTANSVTVWYGSADGIGQYGARKDIALPAGAVPEALAMLTVGNAPALAVALTGLDQVTLLGVSTGAGGGTLGILQTLPACDGPTAIVAAELDNAAGTDLAVACGAAGVVRVYRFTGGAGIVNSTWSSADYTVGAQPRDLAAGTFDFGGPSDLATADAGNDPAGIVGTATPLENRLLAPGSFTVLEALEAPAANGVAIGDFDGDQDGDLAVAIEGAGQVQLFHGRVVLFTRYFDAGARFDVGAAPRTVALGDVDGNGAVDIATAARGDDAIGMLLQNKTDAGSFYRHRVAGLAGAGEHAVVLRDLDGDGQADFVVVAADRNTIVVTRTLPGIDKD